MPGLTNEKSHRVVWSKNSFMEISSCKKLSLLKMRPQIENGPIPMVQSFIDQIECILCFCSLDLVSTIYSFERFYRERLGWHFV